VPVLGALTEVRAARVEEVDPPLDALERPDHVPFEPDEDIDRVFVGAAADLLGVGVGLGDDPPTLRLGLLGEAPLVDQEGGLLLRPGDDPLGLFLGLLDDPLALGVDPLRRPDLLGDRDPQLVDQAERRCLVDDDVVRQWQPLAVRDDRLEALDEEDDVRRRALRASVRRRRRDSPRAGRPGDYRTAL
jgi:hypothetical protein